MLSHLHEFMYTVRQLYCYTVIGMHSILWAFLTNNLNHMDIAPLT